MNHLAHLLLAGPEPGLRVGALLGDHLRGRQVLEELPGGLARGVRLHRLIDSHCDAHPAVGALVASLPSPFRRYGGVIVDVLFDHMLTRHWKAFAGVPLPAFADSVDAVLSAHSDWLPERLRRFALWARMNGLWARYGERDMLARIFAGLNRRHGRPSPLHRGLEVLDARESAIEEAFLEVFPDLETLAARYRQGASDPAKGSSDDSTGDLSEAQSGF